MKSATWITRRHSAWLKTKVSYHISEIRNKNMTINKSIISSIYFTFSFWWLPMRRRIPSIFILVIMTWRAYTSAKWLRVTDPNRHLNMTSKDHFDPIMEINELMLLDFLQIKGPFWCHFKGQIDDKNVALKDQFNVAYILKDQYL